MRYLQAHPDRNDSGEDSGQVAGRLSASVALVRQPHGGAIRQGGNPRNRGGLGAVPSKVRARLLRSFAQRVQVLESIVDDPLSSTADRLRAMDLMARYGLGTEHRVDAVIERRGRIEFVEPVIRLPKLGSNWEGVEHQRPGCRPDCRGTLSRCARTSRTAGTNSVIDSIQPGRNGGPLRRGNPGNRGGKGRYPDELGARNESEVLWLQWQDVELDNGFVRVVTGRDGHRTKTGRSRWVPMSARLLTAMRAHFARYRFSAYDGKATPWVFHHDHSRRTYTAGERVKSFHTAFRSAVKRAKLPPTLWMYDLRHRRITNWMAEGQSPVHVRDAAGHADLRTTMRYTHLTREHLRPLAGIPEAGTEQPKEAAK